VNKGHSQGFSELVLGRPSSSGYGDGTASTCTLTSPTCAAVDSATGDMYICDDHTIRRWTACSPSSGLLSTVLPLTRDLCEIVSLYATTRTSVVLYAGSAEGPGSDDGPLHTARFWNPCALCIDSNRRILFVGDQINGSIRAVALPAVRQGSRYLIN